MSDSYGALADKYAKALADKHKAWAEIEKLKEENKQLRAVLVDATNNRIELDTGFVYPINTDMAEKALS